MSRTQKSSKLSKSTSSRNRRLDYNALESKLPLTSFVVTGLGDDNGGVADGVVTLREAVIAANTNAPFGDALPGEATGDRITFDPSLSGGTITLTEGQLTITDDLLIQGGNTGITIDANSESRHFEVATDEQVAFGQLSMVNGSAEVGGSISAVGGGDVIVVGADFSNNVATGSGGGAIFNDFGNVFISAESTFVGNIANGDSGSGGAILSEAGTIAVAESSFMANVANRAGGAVEIIDGAFFATDVTMGAEGMGNIAGPEGSAAPGNGGAFHVTGSATIGISGGTYEFNIAAQEGGALWNQVGSNMFITGNTVISNNIAAGNDADDGGGGIFNNGGNVVIRNAVISSNSANGESGSGGGIFSTDGRILVLDSKISANTSTRAGGGVELIDGFIAFTDSMISGNDTGVTLAASPGNGGGLHVSGESTVIVASSTFSENMAGSEGGGLWNQAGSQMFINGGSEIFGNTALGADADNGGGGVFNNGGDVTIVNSEIFDNVASGEAGSGGGIFSTDGRILVLDSEISSNVSTRAGGGVELIDGFIAFTNSLITGNDTGVTLAASPGNGGGLHVTGESTVIVASSTFSENVAGSEGGGLWNQAGSLMFINNGSEITDNTALGAGADNGGGGVFNNGGEVTIVASEISGNVASGEAGSGGGIFSTDGVVRVLNESVVDGNSATRAGGGIEVIDGRIVVTNSTLSNNDAGVNVPAAPGNGGALHVTGNLATVVLSAATVTGNQAQEGGGLWNQSESLMFVRDGSIIANNSVVGDGVGGGVYNRGFLLAVDATFEMNSTGGDGGAYFGTDTSRARIVNGSISTNTAGDEGGAIFNNGNLSVLDSAFAVNVATTDGGAIFTGESGRLTRSGNSFTGNLPNNIV